MSDVSSPRTWRVLMKTGETRIVTAQVIECIGSLGISFLNDGVPQYGAAFGNFIEFEEIDPDSGSPLCVERDSQTGPTATRVARAPATVPLLRRSLAAPEYLRTRPDSDPLARFLRVLPDDGTWVSVADARKRYLELRGGFPPNTYKAFNEAYAAAGTSRLIETQQN